jgi:putative transposase
VLRHDRCGHLFQARFHAQVVRDDEHLAPACAYVFGNPVRAGLCAHAHACAWQGGELSVVGGPAGRPHHATA